MRWNSRSSVHLTSSAGRTPIDECDELLDTLGRAVGLQRLLAQSADLAIIGASACIPVFLLLSTQYLDFYLGKLIPAVLAALTAALALVLKVTKTHEKWRLLRSQQAYLEAERFRYLHHLGTYADDDRDSRLLNHIVEISEKIAGPWFELMPDSSQVAHLIQDGYK
jgi:hypothetical protein